MRPSIYQAYPLLALLVLAGATVWLERVTRDDRPPARTETRQTPDITADQTRLISFDASGKQRYELLADRIVNFPQANITELEQPRLRYHADGRELRISARAGVVSRGGDEVFLTGDVRAFRDGGEGAAALSFASESLRVWPDDERAETQDPVVLTQGATTARAQGMRSDNLFGTLELLGDVHVHMPRSDRTAR